MIPANLSAKIPPATLPDRTTALHHAAQQMEAGFLAEMLTAAGLGKSPSGFGGGTGEDQFASFLVREQALAMVRAGGIGLAEQIFASLTKGQDT